MDNDLLLDLRHLDDPDPPRFEAERAEEASRLAARRQTSRARLVAGAVLAVALLAGGLAAAVGLDRSDRDLETAQPPLATTVEDPTTSLFATTLPEALAPPTTTATDPPPPLPDPVIALPGSAASGPTPPSTSPATTRGTVPVAGVTPTTLRPAAATGASPQGAVPAPTGLRLTLTLDAAQVRSGSSVSGVLRFENNRSTSVTLAQPGCGPVLQADLYDAGQSSGISTCQGIPSIVVLPGTAQQVQVQVFAQPALRAGTYDAFATTRLEEDGVTIHSDRVVLTVVRP